MQTFSSKIDLWLLLVLLLAIVVCVLAAFGSLRTGNFLAAIIVLVIGAGLPAWLLLSTYYIVTDKDLIVRSGPFRWRVQLTAISSVQPTSNPGSSPALSLDRLAIHYDNGKTLLVSPQDKKGFRAAIGQ